MQAERGARGGGGRGRRPGAAAVRGGGSGSGGGDGDGDGRRGRGRGRSSHGGHRGRGGRGGGGRRGGGRGRGRPEPGVPVEDSDAETYGEENDEQGNYSKRKIISNWDRYQDDEKEVDNENGESQRGTDFSVLLSSAGDSFSQFRFAEEKEWDGEVSCPKLNSTFYVNCESLVQALQELPLSLRLNVAADLVQTALPLELPQVKPKRNEGKGLGMQLKGPVGSIPELKSAGCPLFPGKDDPRLASLDGLQRQAPPLQSAADHLEEELDLLLSLEAPIKEGDPFSPDQTPQNLGPEENRELAQEEKVLTKSSMLEEKNLESKHARTSKNVTEEELEDWLDSMIS